MHFFLGKWPNIACIFSKLLLKFTILLKKLQNCPFKWFIRDKNESIEWETSLFNGPLITKIKVYSGNVLVATCPICEECLIQKHTQITDALVNVYNFLSKKGNIYLFWFKNALIWVVAVDKKFQKLVRIRASLYTP